MANIDTPSASVVASAAVKPAVAAETADPSRRSVDSTAFAGKHDNNGALLGVAGAKYVESKPAIQYDEKGVPLSLKQKFDANGNPVNPQKTVESIGSISSTGGGAGDSYKAMAVKLDQQRQEAAAVAAKHQAELMKTQIVQEIRGGNTDPTLHTQLAKLNKDIFNLPADHTGY
ncbi:MAG: hypothetical protein KBA75_02660 [Alphaproteobacteria bacterium]|nr:hypothetical protein [Alphaproteobacteria bacterium]